MQRCRGLSSCCCNPDPLKLVLQSCIRQVAVLRSSQVGASIVWYRCSGFDPMSARFNNNNEYSKSSNKQSRKEVEIRSLCKRRLNNFALYIFDIVSVPLTFHLKGKECNRTYIRTVYSIV